MQPHVLSQDKPLREHATALQALANGEPVAYANTLRAVKCEGGRALHQPPQVSRKPPVLSAPGSLVCELPCRCLDSL